MQAFDGALRDNLQLLSASISPADANLAKTVFTFRVTRPLCNSMGNLHGGAVALVFDICTSMTIAPAVREGFWDTGHVSRTLNCTYLRPAPEGSVVEVESEIVHLGRRMGLTKGVMKVDGKVCYTCEHGKAALEASKM